MSARPKSTTVELAGATRRGLVFSGSAYGVRQTLEFAISIALARLLTPADFGVVAVSAIFLQLSYEVGNLGMGSAIVQAVSLSKKDRHVAFTLSSAMALALTLGAAALAPAAARFFGMPALRWALPIMASQIVLAGLAAVPLGLLRRELRFGTLGAVEIGATLAHGVTGICLAAAGWGLWSLVWAPLVAGVWSLVCALLLSRYRPSFAMARQSARKLFGFGGALTVKNVFVQLGRNSDNLVAAKLLGDTATGLYVRAFKLSTFPQTRLVSLMYEVCFPVFCRLKDDAERFREWYLKATICVAVVTSPLLIGLFVMADDFTIALLGDRWLGMVGALRVLAIAGLLNSLHMLASAAIEASGRLRYEIATESINGLLIPIGSVLGAPYGIVGVSYAVLAAAAVMYGMKAFTMSRAIGLSVRRYLGAVVPALVAALTMAAVLHLFMRSGWSGGAWRNLAVALTLGPPAYVGALLIVGPDHLALLVSQIRQGLADGRARAPLSQPIVGGMAGT